MLRNLRTAYFLHNCHFTTSVSKVMQKKIQLDISQGRIVGVENALPNGKPFYAFKGIPYAQPPIGELRFAAPKPLEKFIDPILDCSRERSVCYHKDMITFQAIGSENCLFLNVYTPKLSEAKDLPVMIWIHGGAFAAGSGNSEYYSPEYLVEQNVIIVTINYRLSVLGFLCLPDAGVYGNSGLKDQRLAMQWVQQNIAKFGGNPDNVTIFGESAGGACVHIHTLSASSRQYFHKAICQSGNAVMEWVIQAKAEEKSRMLAKLLGCTENDPKKILKFLQNIDDLPTLFKEYFRTASADEKRRGLPIIFKPTVERDTPEAIITESPLDLMQKSVDTKNIPIMMGYNSLEGLIMLIDAHKGNKIKHFDEDLARFIPKSVNIAPEDMRCNDLADRIRQIYLNSRQLNDNSLPDFANLLTDYHFTIHSYLAAELHSRYQNSPFYFYRFAIDKDFNLYKRFALMAMGMQDSDKFKGACHADEIYYLFTCSAFEQNSKEFPESEALLRRTCALWTNFAKYGNPTPPGSNLTQWNPLKKISSDSKTFELDYLEMDNHQLISRVNPDEERIKFWRQIYDEFNNGLLKAKL